MDGKVGRCPEWYTLIQAAKYHNTTVLELMNWPIWWVSKAIVAMMAEKRAQDIIEQRNARR